MDLLGEVGREEAGVVVVGCLGHLGGGGGVGRGIGSRGGLRKREEEEEDGEGNGLTFAGWDCFEGI